MKKLFMLAVLILMAASAMAAHPTKLAVYGETEGIADGNIGIKISTGESCSAGVIYDQNYTDALFDYDFNIMLGDAADLNMNYNQDYYLCVYLNSVLAIEYLNFRGGQGQIAGDDLNLAADSLTVQDLNVLGDANIANMTISGVTFNEGGISVEGDSNFVNIGILSGLYLNWLYATGLATFAKVPTGAGVGQGSVYINPASASSDRTLLGLAVGGVEKFRVDAEGDIFSTPLTSGRVLISGTSGLITSDSALTYSTSTDTLTMNTGQLDITGRTGVAATAATDVMTVTGGTGGAGGSESLGSEKVQYPSLASCPSGWDFGGDWQCEGGEYAYHNEVGWQGEDTLLATMSTAVEAGKTYRVTAYFDTLSIGGPEVVFVRVGNSGTQVASEGSNSWDMTANNTTGLEIIVYSPFDPIDTDVILSQVSVKEILYSDAGNGSDLLFTSGTGGAGGAGDGGDGGDIYLTTAAGGTGTVAGVYGDVTIAKDGGNLMALNNASATGTDSVALGENCTASGNNSTAFGLSTSATGNQSTTLGNSTTASGGGSIASGLNYDGTITASGDGSTAGGLSFRGTTTAIGNGSMAFGYSDSLLQAAQNGAISLGYNTKAFGSGAIALGYDTNANGQGAFAAGDTCTAIGTASFCLGDTLTNYNANSVLVNDLNVLGDANFYGNVKIGGTLFGGSIVRIGTDMKIAGDLNVSGYATYKNRVVKYHRVIKLDTGGTDWNAILWDLNVPEESDEDGFYLIDNNQGINVKHKGIYRVQGCIHSKFNTAVSATAKIAVRVMVDGIETRCLQASRTKTRVQDGVDSLEFAGTIFANIDSNVTVQYKVDNTDLDLEGDTVFDAPVSASINMNLISTGV